MFHPVIRLLGLILGLCLCSIAVAGNEALFMEQELKRVDQLIGETQAELQTALADYDQKVLSAIGSRLRELKLRRAGIVRRFTETQDQQRRNESAQLVRERPEIARQLEALKPQIRDAAAAFAANPTPGHGARLRALSAQEIELKSRLESADTVTKDDANKGTAGTGGPAAVGTRPK
jgi:hypothetical protein